MLNKHMRITYFIIFFYLFLAPSGAQEMLIFVPSSVYLSDESLSRASSFSLRSVSNPSQILLRSVSGQSLGQSQVSL